VKGRLWIAPVVVFRLLSAQSWMFRGEGHVRVIENNVGRWAGSYGQHLDARHIQQGSFVASPIVAGVILLHKQFHLLGFKLLRASLVRVLQS